MDKEYGEDYHHGGGHENCADYDHGYDYYGDTNTHVDPADPSYIHPDWTTAPPPAPYKKRKWM